jgi:transcriptional regulator with XRE-family HTH domain
VSEKTIDARLGEQIRANRRALKLTQAEVAETFGVARATWITWERGSRIPQPAYRRELERWFAASRSEQKPAPAQEFLQRSRWEAADPAMRECVIGYLIGFYEAHRREAQKAKERTLYAREARMLEAADATRAALEQLGCGVKP